MHKISFFFIVTMALLIWCFVNPLIAYEGDSEEQKVLIDTIISTHVDPAPAKTGRMFPAKTGRMFIDLKDASYPVFKNVRVYNLKKKNCSLTRLNFPFTARIVMLKDEQGLWNVIEIKPHEE